MGGAVSASTRALLPRSSAKVRAAPLEAGDRLVAQVRAAGLAAGLSAVGVGGAEPMQDTRAVLTRRKAAGLSGGMQFTYRNPARSTDPAQVLAGARSLVVGAWSYLEPEAPGGPNGAGPSGQPGGRPQATVARYARRPHYDSLRQALAVMAGVLEQAGWRARVVADDNALVDRAAAQRAGVGWFGHNTNILLPGLGSWFVLGSVVTDAPLPASTPVDDGCGPCRRCRGACPTGALVEDGVLDARICLAWLLQAPGPFPRELRPALGERIYGCDDCQDVCPANRVARRARSSTGRHEGGAPSGLQPGATVGSAGVQAQGLPGSGGAATLDVLGLLDMGDGELVRHYGRWYIPHRDPRYIRRNALVVLGNTADAGSSAVAAVLERYLGSVDDLLRSHAVWAALRIGRSDLVERSLDLVPPGPLVLYELGRARPGAAGPAIAAAGPEAAL